MQKQKIFAFLVAIDKYPIEKHRLDGCVNDMRAFKGFLESRFSGEEFDLSIKVLEDEQSTRANIVDGFLSHLSQADARSSEDKDIAIFYYSGHGAQEPSPPEFWEDNPDKLNQSIVCWDSRTEGGSDLADKELGFLTSRVSGKITKSNQENTTFGKVTHQPEFLIVMDCCHSGSGTRSAGESTKSRQMEVSKKQRKLSEYLGYETKYEENGKIKFRYGKHILLAAAASHQTAKETKIDGVQRGVFTYSLLKALRDAKNKISYSDLMGKVNTAVFNLVQDQTPQLEAVAQQESETKRLFLDGKLTETIPFWQVKHDKLAGWKVNMGSLHGLPSNSEKPITFHIFPEDATNAELSDPSKSTWTMDILHVEIGSSELRMPASVNSDQSQTFKAVLAEVPDSPMHVFLSGDSTQLSLLTAVLREIVYVKVTENLNQADFQVIAESDKYTISNPHDSRAVCRQIKGFNANSIETVVGNLEHISRWKTALELHNPNTDYVQFPLEVSILEATKQVGGKGAVQEEKELKLENIVLQNHYTHGVFEPKYFRVKLTNTSPEPLFVGLMYLTGKFGIQPFPLKMKIVETQHGEKRPESTFIVKIQPNESLYGLSGNPIKADLTPEYAEAGIMEGLDVFKVVASTDEFDFKQIKPQGSLKLPILNARSAPQNSDMWAEYEEEEMDFIEADWTTKNVFIKTVKPLPLQQFGYNQPVSFFGERVQIQAHPMASGLAGLSNASQVSRSLGKSAFPPKPENAEFEEVKFTPGWGSDLGLCVLEFCELKNSAEVSESNPIQINFGSVLGKSENIIAYGVNQTGYEVCGKYNPQNRKVELFKLPEATETATENLPDSSKIVFIREYL
jgi:hypothetical protein